MCRGCCAPGSDELIGNGHFERSAVYTHLVGGLAVLAYAVARSVADAEQLRQGVAASWWTTAQALVIATTFFVSVLHHVTTPDDALARWTRPLDFVCIYALVAVGTIADLAIATRGFDGLAWQTVADVPLAALAISAFFLLRSATIGEGEASHVTACAMSPPGLFWKARSDAPHRSVREATFAVLSLGAFQSLPLAFVNLQGAASLVVGLKLASFGLVCLGLLIDKVLVFPDRFMGKGEPGREALTAVFAYPRLGCVLHSHALWHVLTVGAAGLASASREVALAALRP